MKRKRLALLAIVCLVLAGVGSLVVKPAILNERSLRAYLTHHLGDWTGGEVSIGSPVRVSYFPRLKVDFPNVRLAGIKRLPTLREIRSQSIEVRLGLWSLVSGTPVVDRITLIEPMINASALGSDIGPIAGTGETPTLISSLTSAPFDQVVLENGEVTVAGSEKSEQVTDIKAKMTLSPSSGAMSSRGTFTWRGQVMNFRHQGGAPKQIANAVKMPLTLHIGGELISADIDGEAIVTGSVGVTGSMNLHVPNLPRFAKWTGVLVPDDQKSGDFKADGSFHWSGHRIGFDEGSFTLDGNRALGAISLDFAGPRPQIEGTLALQKLDLSQYFRTDTPAAGPPQTQTSTASPERVGMDFPLMHHLNIDLRLSTTELVATPVSLSQSALSLNLNSGRLAADIAVFNLCGGSGNARLEFDATVPDSAFAVTIGMNGVSARKCIEFFTPDSHLEGTANVTASVTSKGRTLQELLEGMVGKASLTMNAGLVDLDFLKLVSNVRTGPVKGWEAARGETTAFQSLKGDFFFRQGGAYTDSLVTDLGKTSLSAEGTVHLSGQSLEMRMMETEPPESQETVENESPGALQGTIVIKGPWSEPSFALEPAKSSARAAPPTGKSQTALNGGL